MLKNGVHVKGAEDYVIYKDGRIFSLKSNKFLKQAKDKDGYKVVAIYSGNGKKMRKVHQLMLESFIREKDGFEVVNHKNGVKHDNRLENLEWVTRSENDLHAFCMKLKSPNIHGEKRVLRGDGKVYKSINEAARDIQGQATHVSKCCRGIVKTHLGYSFSYLKEEDKQCEKI